jgi:hypothetical protein
MVLIPGYPALQRKKFPEVLTQANNRTASNVTSHPVTLPSNINVGDLLIVAFSCDAAPTLAINTSASGSNWTTLPQNTNGSVVTGVIYWKIAEGSDALTINTSALEQSSHCSYRIRGGNNVTGNSTNGSSTNSDPPNHNPGAGNREFLWITTRHGDSNVNASATPTGFGNNLTMVGTNTNGVSTNICWRNYQGANLDPGTWTSATEQWVSFTLAVWPKY